MKASETNIELSLEDFERSVVHIAGLHAYEPDAERKTALFGVLAQVVQLLAAGGNAAAVLAALPAIFDARMSAYGWCWNGFYVLRDDGKLHLGFSIGPPVCAELERSGGPLTSGMCFDGILLNQTLVAADVADWPGYVSCDAHSGLRTIGGIVSPLRDPDGKPLGVWDLDSTQTVTAGDGRFIGALFATLSKLLRLRASDLGA
ncbi:MAG: putative methionine-R-sulfoxide reductase with GAF domain [Planctomycetota bacterium]|jgi:putative methionine-R-sulfoxide reductase with GAF domain